MDRDPGAPLRVLVVSAYGTVGGSETWLLQLLDATSRLSVEFVVLQDGPLRDELGRRGLSVTVDPTGRRPVDLLAPTARLARTIRARRPDVVLANGVKAQLVAGPAAWLAGAPVVWAKHDHSYDRLAPALGRLSDAVIASVEEVGQAVHDDGIVVIPPPRAGRPPARRSEARSFLADHGIVLTDDPTMVMATRLVPYKGVDDAIDALARPGGAGWRLVVVGDDDIADPGEKARLQQLAASIGVSDRVSWCSYIPEAGPSQWLAAFDALAVLTKPAGRRAPGREGFGIVVLEAMLAGVPVIATGGGAIERRLAGAAGLTVPPGDPAAVAAALGRLADADVRARYGAEGRRLAADHPEAATLADELVSALARTSARPGAGLVATDPISVVVPVYNEGEGVDRILAELRAQLCGDDEIVVVNDGSRDDTGARADRVAAQDSRVRVVHRPRNGGVGAARNTGVAAARHDLIAFTDAGCHLAPSWLAALRQAFAEKPRPDFVAGVYHASSGGVLDTATAVACYPDVAELRRPDWLVRIYGRLFGRVFAPDRPAGRSLAFTREAYVAVGGFREDMAATEDVDFSTAVSRSGRRCVLAVDADLEWVQDSMRGTARMYRKYGRGDARSADRAAVMRDGLRAVAYATAPVVVMRGGRVGRAALAAGSAAYLSLPLRRASKRPRPAAVMAAVPIAVAVKDLAKVSGFLAELARGRGER